MRTVIAPTTQEPAKLCELIDYLHNVRERERVALARHMHDDLGGLLVSAAMDLGGVESRASSPVEASTLLRRLRLNLASAIDLKRQIIEELRPSLLDNFGLFEALRWYFKHACQSVAVRCHGSYPAEELSVTSLALSNVFRATQTLLDCTFAEADLVSVDLNAAVEYENLSISINHEHDGLESVDVQSHFRHELESVAHRVAVHRGELSFDRRDTGLCFYLRVPLAQAQRTNSAPSL